MRRPTSYLLIGPLLAALSLGCADDARESGGEVGPGRPPSSPPSQPPPERVRLNASNVAQFLEFAALSGSGNDDYVRSELDRIHGDTAIEDAFEAALEDLWSIKSGAHRISETGLASLLLNMIKHLRLPRTEQRLAPRIELFVSYDGDEMMDVAILQAAGVEALACVETDGAQRRVEGYAQNHPSASVRNAAEGQLRYKYCKYMQSATYP